MSKMAYTILRVTQRHWRKSRQRKRHCNLPMNPVNTATYLGVQQAATAGRVSLPPNLIRQLTRTLVIARITALSTQALAYFLQAVLNAAIGFQALHLTHPQHMLHIWKVQSKTLPFFERRPVRTKFWAGAPSHAKYNERGYNIQKGLLVHISLC